MKHPVGKNNHVILFLIVVIRNKEPFIGKKFSQIPLIIKQVFLKEEMIGTRTGIIFKILGVRGFCRD